MRRILFIFSILLSFIFNLSYGSDTKKIIDDLGLEVEVPNNPQRIVIADLPPLVHAYYVVNSGIEGLVGAPQNNALTDTILPIVYPEVKNLSTGFRSGGELNIEALLALEPDLIFYRSDNQQTGEIIRSAGVPAVAFQTFNAHGGNTVAAVASWLKTLGEILNKQETTHRLIANAYENMGIVQSKMWNIAEEDKVRMIYFNGLSTDENGLKVSGSGLFGKFWAEIAKANDVASQDIKGVKPISIEQLYKYNPEVIFLTFSKSKPENLYNNPLLADIDAIKNKRVYTAPMGMFSWYGPSTDVALSFLWHAKMLYPKQFSDIDIIAQTKKHYKEYYGYELLDADIEFLFSDSLEILRTND
ncbi:MAG: ABC transporter substrate-binding protein [Alphaproteobacteria bacterium]